MYCGFWPNRLTTVVVMDPHCKYPVGYATGEVENHALIMQALRNAVQHTQELFGNYYAAWQLQSDHYGIKPCKMGFEELAKYITPARARKPWPKPIESYFLKLNKYCQMHFSNWSGFGVTSQRDNQPNIEWFWAIRKQPLRAVPPGTHRQKYKVSSNLKLQNQTWIIPFIN